MEDDEEQIDAWGDLGSRYGRDDHAQFVLFVEQLAGARELLIEPSLSKQRMALVAVDNLAELVLFRHKQRLANAAQESWRDVEPRLDAKDLERFQSSFDVRVDLGGRGAGPGLLEDRYRPVLDTLDAVLFRVGHRYRNRAYHADHHNPAALELVAKAYFFAVGRAFRRLQPGGYASSMSSATSTALRAHGYSGSREFGGSTPLLAPLEAADAITSKLSTGLEIEFTVAANVLRADMAHRVAWTRAMIRELLEDGMPEDRLEFGLQWTFKWRAIAVDPKVVELERQLHAEWRRRVAGEWSEESFECEAQLMEQRNDRVKALLAGSRNEAFDLPGSVDRLERGLEKLESAEDLASLVGRYERLDTSMEEIEDILDEAAIGWDRWVQQEIDRIRGK